MNYWEERYQKGETGWDAGKITTPIKEYIDQLTNKNLKILIQAYQKQVPELLHLEFL